LRKKSKNLAVVIQSHGEKQKIDDSCRTAGANQNFRVLIFLLEREIRKIKALALDPTMKRRSE